MSGPRKLGALLNGWNAKDVLERTRPNLDQAAGELAAAWERAVGAQIARRSRPTKLNAGVLTVLTASSAWSDELTFLAPNIIEALQRSVPVAKLRRLRFMVASGRTKLVLEGARFRGRSMAVKQQNVLIPATNEPPIGVEEDASATVARLAHLQRSLDEWRDRAGWRTCIACQRRFLAESSAALLCAPCAGARRKREEATIERAMMQAPWLTARELRQQLPDFKPAAYQRTRQRLLTRWQFDIAAAERRLRRANVTPEDRVIAWSYLMLLTGKPERDIGRAVARDLLGLPWTSALFEHKLAPKEEARRTLREKHS